MTRGWRTIFVAAFIFVSMALCAHGVAVYLVGNSASNVDFATHHKPGTPVHSYIQRVGSLGCGDRPQGVSYLTPAPDGKGDHSTLCQVPAHTKAPPREALGSHPASRAAAFLALTKPRIIELLLITTIPTMLLAERGVPPVGLMVATVVGGALAAGGANAANMVLDRDIDAKMTRTARRPLVTGALTPRTAVLFAATLELVAFLVLAQAVNLVAAVITLGAAVFYVGVYTAWLKRRTPHNIVIGGVAGAAPALVAWSAVRGYPGPAAWGLFALVMLWTPPHFWALAVTYSDDYASAEVPMLPVVSDIHRVADHILGYSVALAACSLVLVPLGHPGWLYLGGAVVLGALFVQRAWRLRARPSAKRAMGLFSFSITYLASLFVLLAFSALVRL